MVFHLSLPFKNRLATTASYLLSALPLQHKNRVLPLATFCAAQGVFVTGTQNCVILTKLLLNSIFDSRIGL